MTTNIFLDMHTLAQTFNTWFPTIRFQVHNIIIFITETLHTPKSTINHTQPMIHWELVTGACKRGNNPTFSDE